MISTFVGSIIDYNDYILFYHDLNEFMYANPTPLTKCGN